METDEWKYNRIVKTPIIGIDWAHDFAKRNSTAVITLPRGYGKSLVRDAARMQMFNSMYKAIYSPAPDVSIKIDFGKP